MFGRTWLPKHGHNAHGNTLFPNTEKTRSQIHTRLSLELKGLRQIAPRTQCAQRGCRFKPSNGRILTHLRLQPVCIRVRHTVGRTNGHAACKESYTCFPMKTKRLPEVGSPMWRSINSNWKEVNKRFVLRQPDHQTICAIILQTKKGPPGVAPFRVILNSPLR